MRKVHSLEAVTPALSVQPWNFAAKDPGVGGWRPLLAQARAADAAGIDRLVVSDHVVLGENLEAYADPKKGGIEVGSSRPGRTGTGSTRSPCWPPGRPSRSTRGS